MTTKGAAAQPKANQDPFLFFGHGFGTSERALECYLWFARAPGGRTRARIKKLLPFPVSAFARFHGELLHFGSDDDLEARISAAYHPAYADRDPADALDDAADKQPRAKEWNEVGASAPRRCGPLASAARSRRVEVGRGVPV